MEIIEVTNRLWDLRVIGFLYDPIQGVAEIKLEDDIVHVIKFTNIKSLVFNQNPSDYYKQDYTYFELNEILFEIRNLKVYKKNKVIMNMRFNIILELSLSSVLILAEKIEIDSVLFDIQ